MKRIIALLSILLLSVMVAGCTTSYGTISGQVVDSTTGQPLAGAAVSTRPATSVVLTDAQGKYTLTDIPAGDYQISATIGLTASITTDITVIGDKTTTADLAVIRR